MTRKLLPPVLPLFLIVAVCETLVRTGLVKGYILPAPSDVAASLARDAAELLAAARDTALSALLGFLLSAIVGIGAAIALASSAFVLQAFYPYAVFFQTVPIIAIAPILVIWFGYGMPTVVASSFIVSVFPVVANTLAGLRSTEPALLSMFRLYGASRLKTLWKLQLPYALPNILTGLRIGAGLAVIGAIVGEFIGGGGLGGVVDVARNQQRVDKVFAAVLLASLIGLLFFALLNYVSRVTLRHWHASERNAS